jgi:hypothetical protein
MATTQQTEAKTIAKRMVELSKRYVANPNDKNYAEFHAYMSIKNVMLVALLALNELAE